LVQFASAEVAERFRENNKIGMELLKSTDATNRQLARLSGRDAYSRDANRDGGFAFYPEDEKRGLKLAALARCHALAHREKRPLADVVEQAAKSDYAPYFKDVVEYVKSGPRAVQKAIAVGAVGSAGEFVESVLSTEFIPLLRAATVVRSMGARVVQLPKGNLTIPKQNATASGSYVGENQGLASSQWGAGNVVLSAKKYTARTAVSNDSLRYASVDMDAFTRDDMVNGFRVREDQVFLRSLGTENQPKGLRYLAAAGNLIPSTAGFSLATITNELGQAILKLEEANVAITRRGWIFAPRTRHALMTIRGPQDNYAFRAEMLAGSLWGFPWRTTTSVPKNLGGGSDESEVYHVEFDDVMVGDVHDIEVTASEEAAYQNEASVLVSAFDLDQTIIRGIARHDLQVRREESISIITAVKWA
jgi:HK97 family phage major capsid protein